MKKKSASKSAFFNLRVLIGLGIALAGISLALLGLNAFAANIAPVKITNHIITTSKNPLVPVGFDCTKIRQLGIDKQENLRAGAIMIACGEAQGGSANSFFQFVQKLLPEPLAFGGTDVDLITGTETFPAVTQSETYTLANPENPNQIVVTYNDSRTAPSNYSGASYSSDGGTTFTRLNPNPFSTGHGTNFGDPVTLYNQPTHTFWAIFLATGCGGQGVGAWKSTDGGVTWSVGPCIANISSGNGDRESGYADNTTTSPHFGNMYVSFNDFSVGGGALRVVRSTDNGATWSAPVSLTSTFTRDVQITGDKVTGDVYVAGMDEGGGGFPHNDTNKIFRSTDGGATWTNTYTGSPFPGPGVTAVGYFAQMFADGGGYWRHEGWGEPAAYNQVVSLVYTQHGTGADPGDVYYIRSTDMGVTFSAPFKLNTDSTTRPQWQANLSVSDAGTLLATWYDARESTTCTKGNPAVPCYRMFSRKSIDNGATWLPDDMLSDVVSPLPGQPDGNIQTTYAGDYDYGTGTLTKHLTSWTDGRVTISGQSQQDPFTDRELVGPTPTASPSATSTATASPTPTATATPTPCQTSYTTATSTGTLTAGGTDIGNHCDDCFTQINLPFPVNVYGAPTSVAWPASNGDLHLADPILKSFYYMQCVPVDPSPDGPWNNTLFPFYDDLLTMDGPFQTCSDCGIFTQTLGTAPNRQFIIRWKTVYFNNAGNAEFEVILTEGSDTLSVIYGDTGGDNGLTAASGIQQDLNVFTSFSCNEATLIPGLRVDYIPTSCGAKSHADGDSYTHRDSYSDGDSYGNSFWHTNGNCHSHSDRYGYFHPNGYGGA